jgi:hypothetical protein
MQSPSEASAVHHASAEMKNFLWDRSLNGYSLEVALINGEERLKIPLRGDRFKWLSMAELDFLWRRGPRHSGQELADQRGAALPNKSTEDLEFGGLLEDTDLVTAIHDLESL